jgi:uncharacterized membrane protein
VPGKGPKLVENGSKSAQNRAIFVVTPARWEFRRSTGKLKEIAMPEQAKSAPRAHPVLAAQRAQREASRALRIADWITTFAGSMRFVGLHVAWFAVWIGVNLFGPAFDPFPFGLLTMIVSLEAIFLSTFVLISQNRVEDRQQAVAEHHYHETTLLDRLLRENTRLTEEIHKLVSSR